MGVRVDHYFAAPHEVNVVVTDGLSRPFAKRMLEDSAYTLRFAKPS